MRFENLLRNYYLATPIFFIIDYVSGWNLRAIGLKSYPGLKYGYYGLCTAMGGVCWLKPSWSSVLGMSESVLNIILLILGIMIPVFQMPDVIMQDGDLKAAVTPEMVGNFAISGTVALIGYYRAMPGGRPPKSL